MGQTIIELVRQGQLPASCARYEAREGIYHNQRADRRLCVLLRGHVKTMTYAGNGKICIQNLYGPSDVFGEIPAFGRSVDFAQALDSVTLIKVCWDSCVRVIPERLINHLSDRVVQQSMWITHLTTLQAEQRLTHALITIAEKQLAGGVCPSHEFSHPVTQEEFAAMVGTTRSRVGQFLKTLDELGAIKLVRGRVLMIDVPRLRELVDACGV